MVSNNLEVKQIVEFLPLRDLPFFFGLFTGLLVGTVILFELVIKLADYLVEILEKYGWF